MAEQSATPGDEGPQPQPAAGGQPSGPPGQAPLGWSPAAGDGTPGLAGAGHPAGPPGPAPAPGQPGELGQAADVTGPGPGPPPARSRRKVIVIAAAAVVLIGGGIGLGVALSSGSSGPSFPSTLLGLPRATSVDTQQATSRFGLFQGIMVHLGVAVYGNANQEVEILTGQWSDAAKAVGLVPATPARGVDELKADGVTDATLFPAGPLGGWLACGDKTLGGQPGIACFWEDGKGIGFTFYVGSASSLSDAAAKTIQVRSAVEH